MKRIKISLILIVLLVFLQVYEVSSNTAESCKTDAECIEMNYCDLDKKKCVHKKIFSNFNKEFIGLVTIVFGSALSNAGGIGGGGLLIPILLLIMNFYTHEAIPISKLMIFTGALTSFFLGFRQKHPTRNSITIDYNIPLLLVPLLLFGTMVGVTLNKVTPPWIILVSLTAVLIINTLKTFKKAKSLRESETKQRRVSADGKDVRVLGSSEESRNQNIEIQDLDIDDSKNAEGDAQKELSKNNSINKGKNLLKVTSNF
jgi:hypothetical protein